MDPARFYPLASIRVFDLSRGNRNRRKETQRGKRERERIIYLQISEQQNRRVNRTRFKIFSDIQVIGIALPVLGRSLITYRDICF